MIDFPEAIEKVRQGTPGVAQGHTGPRVAHDRPDLLPLNSLVTMDRTAGTAGLFRTVRTFFQAFSGILQQGLAVGADGVLIRSMMMRAINFRHAYKGRMFTLQPAGQITHAASVLQHPNPGVTVVNQKPDVTVGPVRNCTATGGMAPTDIMLNLASLTLIGSIGRVLKPAEVHNRIPG